MHKFLQEMHYKDIEAVFIAIGYGKLSSHQVLTAIVPKNQIVEPEPPKESIWGKVVGKLTKRQKGLVKVSGLSDVLVSFGKCCNPVPGDSIIGYVTHGKGVSIHIRDCQKILAADPDRLVSVEWDASAGVGRVARIKITCVDRPGLLANITETITEHEVNITQADIKTIEDKKAINIFDIEIKNVDQLRQIIQALERIKGVISVERVRT